MIKSIHYFKNHLYTVELILKSPCSICEKSTRNAQKNRITKKDTLWNLTKRIIRWMKTTTTF